MCQCVIKGEKGGVLKCKSVDFERSGCTTDIVCVGVKEVEVEPAWGSLVSPLLCCTPSEQEQTSVMHTKMQAKKN